MPKKIKNEEGAEEEVFTAEELQAQRDAAVEEYKKANPDKGKEIETLTEELRVANEALANAGGPVGANFKVFRDKVEKLETALEKVKSDAIAEVEKVRGEMGATALEAAVRGLAGEDAELAKKVRFNFTETLKTVKHGTPEEFTKKIQQAYLLAAGREPSPEALGGAVYGSGGAGPGAGAGAPGGGARRGTPIKPEVVEMGKRYFGLTDEDFKKYDRQDFSHTK